MKILLDACVWRGTAAHLQAAGHDAVWVGDWPGPPTDAEILRSAATEGRVIVTLDKDFGELVVLHAAEHRGIIRLVGIAARRQGPVCIEVLARYQDDLAGNPIITVEPGRVRIRTIDLSD